MSKSIIRKRKTIDPDNSEEFVITETLNNISDNNSNINNDSSKMIIELIKMNENNTNIKLDSLSKKIDNLMVYNKEEDSKIRCKIKTMKEDFTNNTIEPLKKFLLKQEESLIDIKKEQDNFIRKEQFNRLEMDLKTTIKVYEKKMLWFNISFLLGYAYILFQSDNTISWKSILNMIRAFF